MYTLFTFDHRPNIRYVIFFILAIILIPIITYIIFYFVVFPDWSTADLQNSFQDIKEILVRFGNLSEQEGQSFSYSNVTSHMDYVDEAIRLAQLDLSGEELFRKIILPLLLVISSFIFFSFKYWMPGITKKAKQKSNDHNKIDIQSNLDTTPESIPEKTLYFLNDFNRVLITVAGFLISILGGFMLSSGLENFYFFLGFETMIVGLAATLAAYPSFIGTVKGNFEIPRREEGTVVDKDIPIHPQRLEAYCKLVNFGAWSLVLGLIILAFSFS